MTIEAKGKVNAGTSAPAPPSDPLVPLVRPPVELTTPAPALHPSSYSDLIERALAEAGDELKDGESVVIADLRVVKSGWEATAALRTRAWGGELQGGVSAKQEWGGKLDPQGRVTWTRKW